ncbi:TPA: hypothetical protein UOJ25_002935 [Stenotrophomonas maltophilia]|nr:hypothetical protein [Stenotrophomonas maltophilia]
MPGVTAGVVLRVILCGRMRALSCAMLIRHAMIIASITRSATYLASAPSWRTRSAASSSSSVTRWLASAKSASASAMQRPGVADDDLMGQSTWPDIRAL